MSFKAKIFLAVLITIITIKNSYPQKSTENFGKAFTAINEKKYLEAINHLTLVIDKYPNIPGAYYNRAFAKYCYYGMDSARNDYLKAAQFGETNSLQILKNYKTFGILMTDKIKEYYFDYFDYFEKQKPSYFTKKDTLRGALRPERNCFDVLHYNLNINFLSYKKIKGSNEITFEVKENTKTIQLDLFRALKIVNINYKDTTLGFTRVEDAFFINFPEELQKGKQYKIKVHYEGKPNLAKNPPWEGGFVVKKDKQGKPWTGVACEHLGASSWWPNKDHLSDEPDSMDMHFTVPSKLKCISNGKLVSIETTNKKRSTFHWKVLNPINNYNVTFYVGDFIEIYDTIPETENKKILKFYVLKPNKERAKAYFAQTKEVVAFYEKTFGEYPFWNDKMALVESPYAGMEHQGAIAIGGDYGNHSDTRYFNEIYDYLIVHEVAHEWWGNSVSVADMADVWIHEGFATYAEMLFLESKFDYAEYLKEICERRQDIFNFFPIVGPKDVNYNTLHEGDVYNKGAQVLHSLRCTINNDHLFFDIIKTFHLRFKRKTVNSDDFINVVNEKTGEDYVPFFKTWLYQHSIPTLEYSFLKKENKLQFTFEWKNVENNFKMPFGILVDGTEGKRLIGTDEPQTLTFENVEKIEIPSGWNPAYNFLPKNTFTYFNKREK